MAELGQCIVHAAAFGKRDTEIETRLQRLGIALHQPLEMRHGIERSIQSREHHAHGPPCGGTLRGKFQGLGDAARGLAELAVRGELEAEFEVRFRILRIECGGLAKHRLGELAASQSLVGQP